MRRSYSTHLNILNTGLLLIYFLVSDFFTSWRSKCQPSQTDCLGGQEDISAYSKSSWKFPASLVSSCQHDAGQKGDTWLPRRWAAPRCAEKRAVCNLLEAGVQAWGASPKPSGTHRPLQPSVLRGRPGPWRRVPSLPGPGCFPSEEMVLQLPLKTVLCKP